MYQKESIQTTEGWINWNNHGSASGLRTDAIYGYPEIGSPHGHAVFFNGSEIFQRRVGNLNTMVSGGIVILVHQGSA
jgi:hypothetical protein